MTDNLKRAIWVLKDYRKGDFVDDTDLCEAIDTVVEALEKPLPTDEDVIRESSVYVDSIRNKIDTYCYCDVNEAFHNGAVWMRNLIKKEETV